MSKDPVAHLRDLAKASAAAADALGPSIAKAAGMVRDTVRIRAMVSNTVEKTGCSRHEAFARLRG